MGIVAPRPRRRLHHRSSDGRVVGPRRGSGLDRGKRSLRRRVTPPPSACRHRRRHRGTNRLDPRPVDATWRPGGHSPVGRNTERARRAVVLHAAFGEPSGGARSSRSPGPRCHRARGESSSDPPAASAGPPPIHRRHARYRRRTSHRKSSGSLDGAGDHCLRRCSKCGQEFAPKCTSSDIRRHGVTLSGHHARSSLRAAGPERRGR